METLKIGTTTKQVPSTWNELTRKQLLRVLAELYAAKQPMGVRLRLLVVLTGFRLPLLSGLPADVLAQLLPLVDFVTSEKHQLTTQLLPTLKLAGGPLHGPRAHLSNVSFGEFIFADTFFLQHHQAKASGRRQACLDKFLAVLYRPARRVTVAGGMVEQNASPADPDWNGDVRVAFNEYHLEARTPRLAPVPELEKLAVLTWYRGCRQQLAAEFPDVFAVADEDEPASSKGPGWDRVLRQLSGGAFGPVQQTAGQPLRLVLAQMQDLAVEYQERRKNLKSA